MVLDLLSSVPDGVVGSHQRCANAHVAPSGELHGFSSGEIAVTRLDVNRTVVCAPREFQVVARHRQPTSQLLPVRNRLAPPGQRGGGLCRSPHSAEAMLPIPYRWPTAVRDSVALAE